MTRNKLYWILVPALLAAACGVEAPPAEDAFVEPGAEAPLDDVEISDEHIAVEPILRPNVTVLDPFLAQNYGILPNQLRVPLAGNEELASAQAGHVVASKYLFFRKVTSVRVDGEMIVLDTVEAALTDAVLQGTFDLAVVGEVDPDTGIIAFYDDAENPFLPHAPVAVPDEAVTGETVPFGQGQYQLSYEYDKTFLGNNIDLLAEAGVDFPNRWYNLTGSGSLRVKPILKADFKPTIKVQGKVSCCENISLNNLGNLFNQITPKIDYARVIATGALSTTAGFELDATVAESGAIDVLVLGQQGALKTIPCYQMGGDIGPLPVTARICPSMRFKGSYKLDGSANFLAKVDMKRTVEAKIQYSSAGGWSKSFNVGTLQTTPTVQREIQFSLEATATLTPRIEADISGVLGGSVQVDATATFASSCVAPNLAHKLSASIGGKADAFFGPISLPIIGGIPQTRKEWTLFQKNYPNLWSSNFGTCVPSYATLSYNKVRSDPNEATSRYLDLDMVVEVPADGAGSGGQVSLSTEPTVKTIPASSQNYPYVSFKGVNAAGRPETANFNRFLDGTYKIWVHDYENDLAGRNIASFSRAGARMSVWLGNGQLREFTAPGGTGTKWNVFSFSKAQGGAVTITATNTVANVDLVADR